MTLSPSYLKLQRCWLRSFPPITLCIYAHGDELTYRLPAISSSLGVRALFNTHLVTAIGFGAIQSFVSAVERTLGIFPLAMQGDTDTDR